MGAGGKRGTFSTISNISKSHFFYPKKSIHFAQELVVGSEELRIFGEKKKRDATGPHCATPYEFAARISKIRKKNEVAKVREFTRVTGPRDEEGQK